MQEQLRRDGVRTGIHYPVPCHLQAPYRRFAQGPLVVAEETAGQLLSLPLFPHITERQIEYVCDCVHRCLDQLAGPAADGDGAMDRRGGAEIGPGAIVDQSVIVGYPPARQAAEQLTIGESPQLRSGTVIYAGSTVGARFATGHNVIIREEVRIGDDVSVWSNSVIDYGCTIGDRVKIHTNCYVAQYTELEDDVFLAPGVTIANDLYPGNEVSGESMAGPIIEAGAQIGVNATILPYVRIGRGAIIGAGSVVTKDVPDGMIAYGNPAVAVRAVPEQPHMESRVRAAWSSRFSSVSSSAAAS